MPSQSVCPRCGWTMLPPKCQNPDCNNGNKQARPTFRPPMRTQRGHGAGGRVRAYRGPEDSTLEDIDEQGPILGYLGRYVPGWQTLSKRQQNEVRVRVTRWLNGLYAAVPNWDALGPPPKEVITIP